MAFLISPGWDELLIKDAIMLGAAVTTLADSAKAYVKQHSLNSPTTFHRLAPGIHQIKREARCGRTPMMPAPFAQYTLFLALTRRTSCKPRSTQNQKEDTWYTNSNNGNPLRW
jgi:hypothetical protein